MNQVIIQNFGKNKQTQSKFYLTILEAREKQQQRKRFALVITEPQYYRKYVNIMEALHLGIYKEENEDWEVYLAIENQYPKLENLDGIIITGSTSAAYDMSENWKEPLFDFLREADKLQIKMLGICFGHQILAHCLGGEARKMTYLYLICKQGGQLYSLA